ncbi:MAG: SMC family ATPase, partial [Staphylococcus epidermidis]|nr:SMC family ATPase [Staphylococcus epidermidis]
MVKFKYVKMNNFMAIKEAELELDNQGLILIEGVNKTNDSFDSNGSSKSTLVSSITYALYGKTEKGLKADDVVNKYEKKNTSVILSFNIGEDNYRVERYRKHKEFKNKVKLFCNDKEITGSTNDVTDKQIQDLFGIDFNTYVNAIIYGQGDIPMFSQATDKGKKEILESITKVEVYKKAQDVAKEKVKEVEEQQNKEQQEIEKLGYQKELKQEQFDKEVSKYNQVMEQKKQEEETFKQRQEEYNNKVKELDEQINTLKQNIPEIENTEFIFSDNYNKAKEGIELIKNNINDKLMPVWNQEELSERVVDQEIRSIQSKINQLDTNDHCPVCGSPIDNSHKVKEKENMETQISQEQEKLKQHKENKQKIEDKKRELETKINQLEQMMKEEDLQKQNHDREIQKQYQQQQEVYNNISQLENSKSGLQKPTLNDYSYIEKPDEKLYKKEQNDIDKAIDKHKDKVVQLETKKNKYSNAVDAFGNKGIRSVVLDFITPFLNERANEYLQTLSGSDIEIEFQTQVKNSKGELKDKFDVIVKNSNGGESYKANS